MKREAINHTKMRRLARFLGIEMWGARGIMESLWSATRDEAPAGNIGKLSNEDIADFIGWSGDPDELVAAMVKAGWLDIVPCYRLVVHDWQDHCEDYIHTRLVMAGLLFANGATPNTRKLNDKQRKSAPKTFAMPPSDNTGAAVVAAIDAGMAATVAATSAAQRQLLPQRMPNLTLPSLTKPDLTTPISAGRVEMSPRFDDFWQRHPGKKLRKDLAAGVWAHMVTVDNEVACFACLERYLASQEVANRAFMNPENWLSECATGGFKATWPVVVPRNRSPSQPVPYVHSDPPNLMTNARMKAEMEAKRRHVEGLDAPA